ncbi:Type I secretion system, outer membrane component LapE [hydrothermal vent metagenome]|uniref:Type I secretion system, outer membrane component LapE n=1 Tax=hydrothermal vent metagenome TaxID=652676 RepID=A0A1W1EJL4_9ZZZZ
MRLKKYFIVLLAVPLFAGVHNLSLNKALKIVKKNNLEVRIAKFNQKMKKIESKIAKGYSYGKLDLTVQGMRSNDAGNVFGFKVQSREATFADFGFAEFDMSGQTNPLPVQPKALNYPDARNHYVTKLSFMLPIYTGGKLSEYRKIANKMYDMSKLDSKKVLNNKLFQTRKTFYDIALVENYITNLSKIISNIKRLEKIVSSMKREGYAKDIDMLEVQARKAEAQSMYSQAKLNRELAYQFLSFLLNRDVSSIRKSNDMAKTPRVTKDDIGKNLDIQKAILGLEVATMAVKVERSNFLPQVGAFAEYGSADDKLFNEFKDKDFYTAGVQVKWNMFNGGIDANNLERAKVQKMKVHDQVELAKKGIALRVKKLQSEIKAGNSDIKSFKAQYRFANRVYKNYQARYREGMVSISDLLMKQSKQLEILLKLLTVKNSRNYKVFELNSILNKG